MNRSQLNSTYVLFLTAPLLVAFALLVFFLPVNGQPRQPNRHNGPTTGATAPDFDLYTQDNKYRVKLSSYRNHKPVVLIFGSYT